MQVVSISGAQGSGKTTLIRHLVAHYHASGKRSAVIVNQDGKVDFDDAFNRTHDLRVEYIRGG